MRKNSFARHCKGLSIFFIIITSVQNVSWGGGEAGRSKDDVSFFQNSKMTAITSLFYCSFTRTRLGGGREYAKGVRFVVRL